MRWLAMSLIALLLAVTPTVLPVLTAPSSTLVRAESVTAPPEDSTRAALMPPKANPFGDAPPAPPQKPDRVLGDD